MSQIHVAHVPGFLPALAAVRQAGGVLLSEDAARQLTITALAVATPHMRAEVLADLADDLAEEFPAAAHLIDLISDALRKALT